MAEASSATTGTGQRCARPGHLPCLLHPQIKGHGRGGCASSATTHSRDSAALVPDIFLVSCIHRLRDMAEASSATTHSRDSATLVPDIFLVSYIHRLLEFRCSRALQGRAQRCPVPVVVELAQPPRPCSPISTTLSYTTI